MGNYKNYILSVFGAILLWAAWPTSAFTIFIFFAFVPLLLVFNQNLPGKKLLKYTYLHMLLWNALTTWWVFNASAVGAIMAIFANSFLMCLPWLLANGIKKRLGSRYGYVALVAFWLSFEYIHLHWELSWPWLTLGNAFSMQPGWVQWYSITGTVGGSLWILASNILFCSAYTTYKKSGRTSPYFIRIISFLALLVIPVVVSKIISGTIDEKVKASAQNTTKNVVVVQPNVDPYDEKFVAGTQESQIEKLIQLSEQQLDTNTSLVVWPETAIAVGVWEDNIHQNFYYQPVWRFLQRHPGLSLVSGIDSYKSYGSRKQDATETARYNEAENFYYDAFNTAAIFHASGQVDFYHKAKLVPGVETLPSFLVWLADVFDDLGGTSGTLGRDKDRKVFADAKHFYVAAPIICYESIYSDYVIDYVRKGANLLTIVTNDGWWDNTPGYKQHMNYARLRAIETRRWIARSANTGISCFIDPLGNIYQPQPWDTTASIKMNIEPLQTQTFYVKYGNYISWFFNVVSVVFLCMIFIVFVKKR